MLLCHHLPKSGKVECNMRTYNGIYGHKDLIGKIVRPSVLEAKHSTGKIFSQMIT